jgi:hypothetical protein
MTPGSSGISAIHRPSSSLSISIFIQAIIPYSTLLRVSYPWSLPNIEFSRPDRGSAENKLAILPGRLQWLVVHIIYEAFFHSIASLRRDAAQSLK